MRRGDRERRGRRRADREDPTVNELERRAAEHLGQEDSVFVPTATMANEIALRVLGEPGDELIAEENCRTSSSPSSAGRRCMRG